MDYPMTYSVEYPVLGVRTRSSCCGEFIFVDESAEDVVTAEVLQRHRGRCVRGRIIGRAETEAAMGSALVVVPDKDRQHSLEMATVDDEQTVETLAANGADPSLGERVGHRRPRGRADDPRSN